MQFVKRHAAFLLRPLQAGALKKICAGLCPEICKPFNKTEQLAILLRVRLCNRLIDACDDLGFLLHHALLR